MLYRTDQLREAAVGGVKADGGLGGPKVQLLHRQVQLLHKAVRVLDLQLIMKCQWCAPDGLDTLSQGKLTYGPGC
jgi:hypothetical protein